MLIPLLIFILVAGGIVGAYAAATNLPSLLAARKLDRRLREVANPFGTDAEADSEESIIKRVEAGALPGVDKLVARTSAGTSLKLLISQSGVNPVKWMSLILQAICMLTNDFTRAYEAFAAKQKPRFEGN